MAACFNRGLLSSSTKSRTDKNRCKRVFALIDMDCFYVQVEQRFCPETKGKPCAVVQYKKWRGGGIIAVSYEARALGVKRQHTGDEAQEICPSVHLFRVPEKRGKADLTRYRESSQEVMDILLSYTPKLERASVDEAFVDITDLVERRVAEVTVSDCLSVLKGNTVVANYGLTPSTTTVHDQDIGCERRHVPEALDKQSFKHDSVEGDIDADMLETDADADDDDEDDDEDDEPAMLPTSSQESKDESLKAWLEGEGVDFELAVGAVVVKEMRNAVYQKLGFTCSAGVAHNKVLAKLAAGMNKPNGQTVLPASAVDGVFDVTPIRKVRNLGGKFGSYIQEDLKVQFIGELRQFSAQDLTSRYGEKSGIWLYNLCRGTDQEPLRLRHLPKSISCGKNFNGPEIITATEKVQIWLQNFSEEVLERMELDRKQNSRLPTLFTVYVKFSTGDSYSRSGPVGQLSADKLAAGAWQALSRPSSHNRDTPAVWSSGVVCLGLSLSKFESASPRKNASTLHSFFGRKPDTAKQLDCNCAKQEGASCSGSMMQLSGSGVPSLQPDDAQTDVPPAAPIQSSVLEASSNENMESPSEHSGSSLPLGLEGDGLINVSGMVSKQKVCLHSEIKTDTKSCTNVRVGGDVSQLLDAAGLNQAVFSSLPSDIQGEIIRDLSAKLTYSADEVGVSSSAPLPCEVCGIPVPRNEVQVHADYHMAAQLSVALQNEDSPHLTGAGNEETTSCTQTAVSRKRPSSNQCNPLSKYFKPSKH